ncbi:MAG: NUDIX domain-containing protein [Acinetobacter populi]|jgi:8-oxo-dGTP diphosphatase|uniref:NUDIX hydrolase n=1 Tax=Acinetobacter populi TaxID=1582270 RepID=UPI0023522812|nr:NUDIX domain-containing protein [Acinetobacter populi]MCH4246628.1 NUDIX domain-containing protein [Acinetobacter populi]
MSSHNTITVASAIIANQQGQLLLVRKKNTRAFMQVGGKLEVDEAAEQALKREILEEIGCEVSQLRFIQTYHTQAANEPDHQLVSHTFGVTIKGEPKIQAELAEMLWLDIEKRDDYPLAPLTKELIIPWWQAQCAASHKHID